MKSFSSFNFCQCFFKWLNCTWNIIRIETLAWPKSHSENIYFMEKWTFSPGLWSNWNWISSLLRTAQNVLIHDNGRWSFLTGIWAVRYDNFSDGIIAMQKNCKKREKLVIFRHFFGSWTWKLIFLGGFGNLNNLPVLVILL